MRIVLRSGGSGGISPAVIVDPLTAIRRDGLSGKRASVMLDVWPRLTDGLSETVMCRVKLTDIWTDGRTGFCRPDRVCRICHFIAARTTCVMCHVSCVMRHASCVMRHVSCAMRHASSVTVHHASCGMCSNSSCVMRPASVPAFRPSGCVMNTMWPRVARARGGLMNLIRCTAQYCIALQYSAVHSTALHCTKCTTMHCSAQKYRAKARRM